MKTNPFTSDLGSFAVAKQPEDVRAQFIRRTYNHLAGAILLFGVLCAIVQMTPLAETMTSALAVSPYAWLIVLAAFMGASWIANKWALSAVSLSTQYMGLGLYVVAQTLIITPVLYICREMYGLDLIWQAGILTIALFLALTLVAMWTRKDFSFLGGFLSVSFLVALGTIVAGIIFGFQLGLFFAAVMIVLASLQILYQTSQVMYHFRPEQHVAASLGLFAAVALLFWYILRILMILRGSD